MTDQCRLLNTRLTVRSARHPRRCLLSACWGLQPSPSSSPDAPCWLLSLQTASLILHFNGCPTQGNGGNSQEGPGLQDYHCLGKEPFSQMPSDCFVGSLLCQDVPFSANEQFKCADEEKNRACKPNGETMAAAQEAT